MASKLVTFVAFALLVASCTVAETSRVAKGGQSAMYTYTICPNGTADTYDETLAVACLQGIINRSRPGLYLLNEKDGRPAAWLDTLSTNGRWLQGVNRKLAPGFSTLIKLAGENLKGAVIWDPDVPATVNVATTVAGVENAVALSPAYYERLAEKHRLPILMDLRGKFTGSETGSSKNDAYRWAIREYLAKGKCSSHLFCLYEDSFYTRETGNISYVVTRDWAVRNRAFVFDLSPWGDEKPADDPNQPLGTDLATYKLLLEEMLRQSNGKHMTEMAGFFCFQKYSNVPGHESRHDPVPTEWETVYLISPYNCYQNTVAGDCYNQSLHSQAPVAKLKQHRPGRIPDLENKAYVCVFMADYDSATPLYQFLPNFWADPERGKIPLAWGINPNLIETYPDVIEYFYSTASENDYFTADASAAGYMNPNRVRNEYLPLFVRHNKRFFEMTDQTIAPMILDWSFPTPEVKDAFRKFSPDGIATIVYDFHATPHRHSPMEPHVWKGMPVDDLINEGYNFETSDKAAQTFWNRIKRKKPGEPGFFLFRIVWASPGQVAGALNALKAAHPEQEIEIVDPYTYFTLLKRYLTVGAVTQ